MDREREREREKERERDRERERERDRDRDREREREREAEQARKTSTPPIVIKADSSSSTSEEEELDKEEEQRRLEIEMIKRRERIERWRAERKLKELEANKKDLKSLLPPPFAAPSAKKWSLEDESEEEDNSFTSYDFKKEPDSPPSKFHRIKKPKDDDDEEKVYRLKSKSIVIAAKAKIEALREEEEAKEEKHKLQLQLQQQKLEQQKLQQLKMEQEEEKRKNEKKASKDDGNADDADDDIDPLDAYMQEVDKEVRKVNHMITQPSQQQQQQGVVILTGVAKKTTKTKDKGELIEQNMDSLEYSSEEELEDIKDTAASLANKHRKELAKIDHSGVDYATFRKNFYVEVPELARMTQQEVEKYRTDLEGIQVKGKGCPKPIKVGFPSFTNILATTLNKYKINP